MAAPRRRAEPTVEERLFEEPHGFDFYRAVSILQTLRPDAAPTGTGSDPRREPVRFRASNSLGFPASAIAGVERGDAQSDPPEMLTTFLGVGGSTGPLPRAFTELIVERSARKDTALRNFLDIFHHRLLSLMYRVREKFRIGLAPVPPGKTRVAQYLYALMGLGTSGLRGRMRVPDRALLQYAGLLTQRPRSAVGLERLLARYFGVPVEVQQFVGQWHDLARDQVTTLGARGHNNMLGDSAVLGTRVWDQQSKIELRVGPVDARTFQRFLPSGDALVPLSELTRFYLGPDIDFSVRLLVKRDEVGETRLGGEGARLAWSAWLRTERAGQDDEQVRVAGV